MKVRSGSRLGILLLCLGTLACGGGGGEVEVKGKLLKGGSPIPVPPNLPPGDQGIHLTFTMPSDKNESHDAKIDPATGNFTVPGMNGRGIKPGTYNIEVKLGAFGMGMGSAPEKTKGAPKGPITRTVEAGKEIVIDLDKPNG